MRQVGLMGQNDESGSAHFVIYSLWSASLCSEHATESSGFRVPEAAEGNPMMHAEDIIVISNPMHINPEFVASYRGSANGCVKGNRLPMPLLLRVKLVYVK